MTSVSKHTLHTVVYVLLVVAIIGALYGYQRSNNNRFEHRDLQSCANRKALLRNQRLVLRYLHSHIPKSQIDPETGKRWWVEFAERVPSTQIPSCKS